MPRPEQKTIQLTIDGREVKAIEGSMLVDAAKHGDVEIPYFCYEPKLGNPVGACRMCLVEIEGIPKLQTSCSTPVKDGMVVHTQTDRVRHAQNAIVEFLLINHPLDCPVCDKGGECPLQDITFGWGLGRSRMIEPKRHFVKPLALSPLVAIDRERCILCYRCVRFSQEIAEDYQLIFAERGADTFVATHDGHPYVAPFSGNIVELCPVGALTSQPYRFRARPWDIEGAGGICTLCPAQCNVTFTVRDERVMRVLARDNPGRRRRLAVRQGSLRLPGDPRRRADHPAAGARRGRAARGLLGARARDGRGPGPPQGPGRRAGRRPGDQRGGLPAPAADARGARLARHRLAGGRRSRLPADAGAGGAGPAGHGARPRVRPHRAGGRLRAARRRADPRPADPQGRAAQRRQAGDRHRPPERARSQRRTSSATRPGREAELLARLDTALAGEGGDDDVGALASLLRDGGEDVVIVWSERIGADAAAALLRIADRLGLADRDGAGLLEIPSGANGRGLREAGVVPDAGPGLTPLDRPGRGATAIARAAADGELTALYLLQTDPVRDQPDRALWEHALHRAALVVAHASVLTEGLREHATVIFPAESHAEKEGTVVHPDGRLQRLRIAIAHPGEVRPGWAVLAELARRAGTDFGVERSEDVFEQLVAAVPFYEGLTLDELGGHGVRWPEREQAAAISAGPEVAGPAPATPVPAAAGASASASQNGALRLGTYRPIWAAPECEISPALQYLIPAQQVELSPDDARRLGIADGDEVEVAQNGTRLARDRRGPLGDARRHGLPGRGHRRRLGQRADRAADRGDQAMTPLAVVDFFEPWWVQIIKALVIFGVIFAILPIIIVYERKLLGRFQNRYGPNRVGPFGLMQPLAEIVKFATKEPFRPTTSVGYLFRIAPVIAILTAVASLALIPFGDVQHIFGQRVGLYGIDVSIGVLYVFAFSGISFYGIMLGGWSSGSKYSFLGAMRGAAQLISYEVSQGLALVGVLITAGTLSLTGIVHAQAGMWYFIPQIVGFLIFMTASFAETNRAPFDLVEADAELVGGYFTEYGGTPFVAYLFAEYTNMIVVSGIAVTMFLGGWLLPFGIDPPGWVDPFVVLVKMLILITFFIWIRATLPRLRYDQLMSFGWKILLPLATLNLLVTAIVVVA